MKTIVLFYSLYVVDVYPCTFLAHGQGFNTLFKIVFKIKLIPLNHFLTAFSDSKLS